MTDFYSQNRCVCSTRSHGPLLCAFCLSFHFKVEYLSFFRFVSSTSVCRPLMRNRSTTIRKMPTSGRSPDLKTISDARCPMGVQYPRRGSFLNRYLE